MLLVLKILGIVLLCILAILILLLILPWTVKVRGDFDEYDLRGYGHSFFRFVTFKAYFEGEFKYRVAVCFGLIPILKNKPRKEIKPKQTALKTASKESEQNKESDETKTKPEEKKRVKKKTKKVKKERSLSDRIDHIFSEKNKQAFGRLIKKIKKLLVSIHVDFKGTKVVYSLFDPSQTGILTGVFAQFPGLYGEDIDLKPDFLADSISIRGQIVFRGRIILFRVLKFVLSVFNDKDIMNLFKG